MIRNKIRTAINEALLSLSIEAGDFDVTVPEDVSNGDYTTNVALSHAKLYKLNPVDLGKRIVEKIDGTIEHIGKVEVAGPGFINLYLSDAFFCDVLGLVLKDSKGYGDNRIEEGKKIIFEYTDPNPFKEFHIGHLMSNTIGESLSRLAQVSGAEVKRACYQGDLGLNVAKAIWGMERLREKMPRDSDPIAKRIAFISEAYVLGSAGYEESEAVKTDIVAINANLFAKDNALVNQLYDTGRKWSLESFEAMYATLGTTFDFYFFESETAPIGQKIIARELPKGTFESSDGAVVFRGEKYGLHTRVFVNSEGFPTYECKELGLAELKHSRYAYDRSIIITAQEQAAYFAVVLKAIEIVFPELLGKNINVTHGMMKLSTGKMSSRKGNVIAADALLSQLSHKVEERMKEQQNMTEAEKKATATAVAVGAIKYSILKQSIGKDIVFDPEAALSLEGDSGPYLQYSLVRARSIMRNAEKEGVAGSLGKCPPSMAPIAKLMYRFPNIVSRAHTERAPQLIATFLISLAGEFNRYYAGNKIVDPKDEFSPYKIALTEAFVAVLSKGLFILGIPEPKKM